jgi:PhnB protein
MRADPYLFFRGRCEEALEFYQKTLGAKIESLVRFGDMPGSPSNTRDPGTKDNVMHAALRIGETTVLASDGRAGADAKFDGFSLSLQVTGDAEAERLFAALAEGGAIEVPLMSTPFASRFGKVADRFGTPWMIVTQQQPAG